MKKAILFSIFLFCFALQSHQAKAQIIWSEDFESYVADSIINPQTSDWVGYPPAIVSANVAASGSQSLEISSPYGASWSRARALHAFGDSTSGRYLLKFKVFIPDSAEAGVYWDIGHSMFPSGGIQEKGLRVHLNAKSGNSSLTLGNIRYPFKIKYGEWAEVAHVFDLDQDSADFFYNGTLLASHPFSNQAFSSTPGLNQLSAIELFAACYNNICSQLGYLDDFVFMRFPEQQNDAGLSACSPSTYCKGSSSAITVRLRNYGIAPIDTVQINWSIDGAAQPSYLYAGHLLPGTDTNILLGIHTFNGNPAHYVKAWTSQPNQLPDSTNFNDTLSWEIVPSLKGNYTIDPSLPPGNGNYTSFSDLADELMNNGICGAVHAQVAPGTYQEQFKLGKVEGSSPLNTITIDGQDSSQVILTHKALHSSDATVWLTGTDHITLKNMSIINTDSFLGTAVHFSEDCEYNTLSNNLLHSKFTIRTHSSGVIGKSGHHNIHNNNINGMVALGKGTGNKLTNNRIDFTIPLFGGMWGLVCSGQDSLLVVGNTIHTQPRGIQIINSSNTLLNNNVVSGNVEFSNDGILLSNGAEKTTVTNNMIMDGMLYFVDMVGVDIFHNSVHYEGDAHSALDIFISVPIDSGAYDVRNNIFSSRHMQAVKAANNFFSRFDHNIYYSGGPILFSMDNYYYQDLEVYQMDSPQFNASSLEVDPNFISDTSDLHLLKSFAYDKGDMTVGITEDIDGDPRPFPGSHGVDIGADEFMPIGPNARAVSWQSSPFCEGLNQPLVRVSNLGADTIQSLWLVYSYGSTMDSVHSAVSIPPSENLDIALNPYHFIADSIYRFLAYTKMPNGLPDAMQQDDTLRLDIRTGLSGIYTIDSSQITASTNFQSFEDMASALDQYGVCGPVTVDVVPGSGPYVNQVWIDGIPGISATNTVSINGNGERIEYQLEESNTIRGVLNFKNTSYLTLDSLKIYVDSDSVEAFTHNFRAGIHILNGCHHMTINNCNIDIKSMEHNFPAGISVSTLRPLHFIYNSGNAYALTLTNNTIDGGGHGIVYKYIPSDSNSPVLSGNNIIKHNKITFNDPQITRSFSHESGILAAFHDSLVVEGNDIYVRNRQNGILCHSNRNSIINRNVVRGYSDNYSSGFKAISSHGDTNNPNSNNFFINNLVYDIKSYGGSVWGLYGQGYFYNNTVSIYDSSTFYFNSATGIGVIPQSRAFNNLISITGVGVGHKMGILLEKGYANQSPFFTDYNNIYLSQGSGPKYYGAHTSSMGTSYTGYNLAAWRSFSNQDWNSLTVDPQFVNPAMGDFTPQNLALDGSGMPFSQVTEDLYGNPRGKQPDIGAIEFDVPVGIEDKDGSSIIALFPNPSEGKFTLVVTPTKKEEFRLSLWDLNGKELFRKEMNVSHSKMESLDFSNLPKGMYLLKIETENEMKTKKLVIR